MPLWQKFRHADCSKKLKWLTFYGVEHSTRYMCVSLNNMMILALTQSEMTFGRTRASFVTRAPAARTCIRRDHLSPLRFTCLHARGDCSASLRLPRACTWRPPSLASHAYFADSGHPIQRVYAWNMNETLAIWKHLLQHTIETAKIFGTYSCNICVKHIQHLDQALATYVWNRWNILNKRLQHTFKTLATYITSG
jgi:hypothetical protein